MKVLKLIVVGIPNKNIAAELGTSFKTIDKHRQHLMAKLNLHNAVELTHFALWRGLVPNMFCHSDHPAPILAGPRTRKECPTPRPSRHKFHPIEPMQPTLA